MYIKFLFCYFIFTLNFKSYIFNWIAIPFNTYSIEKEYLDDEFNVSDFYYNYFQNKMYAQMKIGIPEKYIIMDLLSSSHGFLIGDLCDKNIKHPEQDQITYNKNFSSSYYRVPDRGPIDYGSLEAVYAGDNFTFFISIEKNSQINIGNITFLYVYESGHYNPEVNESIKICGRFGLSASSTDWATGEVNFIKRLKNLNKINNYDFSLYFENDDSGFLIIGEKPHICLPNLFDENDLRKTNIIPEPYSQSFSWTLAFDNIYYNINDTEENIKEGKKAYVSTEYKYIIGTAAYKKSIEENFFKKYLDNKTCDYKSFNKDSRQVLFCNKTDGFSPESFPTLYFLSRVLNYTFEFTKEDLFLEKSDKYIFLVIFRDYETTFTLGKILLRKYVFTFNQIDKTIGFYINTKKKLDDGSNNTLAKILIGVGVVIIFAVGGIILAKILYGKSRKKRKNELDDNYDYSSKEENIINEDDSINDNKKNNDKKIIIEDA